MIHGHVNYLAVLTAAIASMGIGFTWFSENLFGNLWKKIIGKEKMDKTEIEKIQQEIKPYFFFTFLAALLTCSVLARIMVWLGLNSLEGGIITGFWIWLGFALPYAFTDAVFSGKDKSRMWPLFLVQTGYRFVTLLVTGAILGAWQ